MKILLEIFEGPRNAEPREPVVVETVAPDRKRA
jgi:hypothetical protein